MTSGVPDWVDPKRSATGGVHGPFPRGNSFWDAPSQNETADLRARLGESIMQRIVQAVQGVFIPGDVGAAFDQLMDWAFGMRETLTEHTEAIIDLQDVQTAMNTTVAYVGDEQHMVSVPRFALSIGTISGSSSPPKSRNLLDAVEFVTVGYYHHATLPVIRPATVSGDTRGTIYYIPIIADRYGKVVGVTWVGGADISIFSIDYYEVALCALNPLTGNIEKAWSSGNIRDAEASTTTISELFIEVDTVQRCSPGQILFVATQQVAPGLLQGGRSIGAVPQASIQRLAAPILDAWCYRAPNHSLGIPSSMNFASLTRENRFIPWAGLKVDTSEEEEP